MAWFTYVVTLCSWMPASTMPKCFKYFFCLWMLSLLFKCPGYFKRLTVCLSGNPKKNKILQPDSGKGLWNQRMFFLIRSTGTYGTSQVGTRRNLRKGWKPVPVMYDSCCKGRLSSKAPTRTLHNFERITSQAWPHWWEKRGWGPDPIL